MGLALSEPPANAVRGPSSLGPRYYFGKLTDPLEELVPCPTGAAPFAGAGPFAGREPLTGVEPFARVESSTGVEPFAVVELFAGAPA